MNKFHLALTAVIIVVFLAIVIVTQFNATSKPSKAVPTLPPDADVFKQITPTIPTQQQVQGQQSGQSGPAPTYGVEEAMKASYSATIKTTKGTITANLYGKEAPNTVKNFMEKAKNNYYKNLLFHRVEDWVVQGGDPRGDGTGGQLVQTELNALPFVTGSLGVARGADIRISNDSQFFIVKQDSLHHNQQYTNFGIVTSGMDVVNKISVGDKILGISVK